MQLGWPESFRRRVEKQFSTLPALHEQWFSLRIVASENHCRVYLNNLLFANWELQPDQVTGRLACRISGEGIVLATARIRRATEDSRFVTVPLGAMLNASKLGGSELDRKSLPTPATPVEVGGVPFTFPVPHANGNDHVDVGESWFQHGFLEGFIRNIGGFVFDGRWTNPLVRNPGRLQTVIPRGQYSRLHLIAASDGAKDSVSEVTAQFYRPTCGYPQEVSTSVPKYDVRDDGATALPVKRGGKTARLHHIVIPIDPGCLSELALMDHAEVPLENGMAFCVEFTKKTRLYRSYPDPISYSRHGAGLPSSVHIYAATLERPVVHMNLQPNSVGHVWTAPARPAYTISLANKGDKSRTVALNIITRSHDGKEDTTQAKKIELLPGGKNEVVVNLPVKKFGYHDLTVTLRDGADTWTEERGFAFLHSDTRDRDWQPGRGPLFGVWSYTPGHVTPPRTQCLEVMGQAGFQTGYRRVDAILSGSASRDRIDEMKAIARKYRMFCLAQFGHGMYASGDLAADLSKGMDDAEAEKKFLEALRVAEFPENEFVRPEFISFFPEPHIQAAPNFPLYYGDPEHTLNKVEQKKFDHYARALLLGYKVVRKHWPDVKIALPHGDPLFAVPFLRAGGEYIKAFDGMAVDYPNFERVPEMQTGGYTVHRLWQLRQEMKKAGMTDPYLIFTEGNFLPTNEGALSLQQQADYQVRNTLHYYSYGIDRLANIAIDYDSASYYGEEHYGAGIATRFPLAYPKPAYAAAATMTRQLNGMNFVQYLPTGSATVFCLQYQHYKDKDRILHVLWTVRGKRPVFVSTRNNSRLRWYDQMDNMLAADIKNGEVGITVDGSPCYLWGLSETPQVRLGDPDHSDSQPGEHHVSLSNLGDGTWQMRPERDEVYENNWPGQMARFLGKMNVHTVDAPAKQGGSALAVQFPKQQKERITMPWYTSIHPKRAIEIPGKGSHLGLWVKANSDWGRVVYCLRDAKDESWMSIGTREQWNCDDIHCASKFCFDGWRYLRFELPSNSPYDRFRDAGTTWWGHFGKGDGVVNLPLRIEKILVERRSHVIYVNEVIPANTADILLGQLNVEYERGEDSGLEAIRLDGLEMPLPAGKIDLDNPVARLRQQGTLPAPAITGVEEPKQWADGTQCHVNFKPVEGATSYDIWVSPYRDGRGAMQLAHNWKEPGGMMRGVRPEVDFYLFLLYRNNKSQSKPSLAYHINLKDNFYQK